MAEINRRFLSCSQCRDSAEAIEQTGRFFYSNGYCNRCGAKWAKERRSRPENVERVREVHRQFYQRHRDKRLAYENARAKKRRIDVLAHYGNSCACCKESRTEFLVIDHINGGGVKHRKELGIEGIGFYQWLIKNGLPEGFRVLCFNCNFALGHFGYCPHGNLKTGDQ